MSKSSQEGSSQVKSEVQFLIEINYKKYCPTRINMLMWSGRSCPTDPYNFFSWAMIINSLFQ